MAMITSVVLHSFHLGFVDTSQNSENRQYWFKIYQVTRTNLEFLKRKSKKISISKFFKKRLSRSCCHGNIKLSDQSIIIAKNSHKVRWCLLSSQKRYEYSKSAGALGTLSPFTPRLLHLGWIAFIQEDEKGASFYPRYSWQIYLGTLINASEKFFSLDYQKISQNDFEKSKLVSWSDLFLEKNNGTNDLRLPYTFKGVSGPSDVARPA